MIEYRRPGTNPTLETRAEANESVNKQVKYAQITEILEENKEGLTAKQIAVEMMKKGYIPTSERNFTAPRLTEMSKKGKVEPFGKTKCEYTHKMVSVYKLI